MKINIEQIKAQLADGLHPLRAFEEEVERLDWLIKVEESKRHDDSIGVANRSEVTAAIFEGIDRAAKQYELRFANGVLPQYTRPMAASYVSNLGSVPLRDMLYTEGRFDERALAFFFGDVMKARLKAAIDSAQWPDADGGGHAARLDELEAHKVKVDELKNKRRAIVDTLREAGLGLVDDVDSQMRTFGVISTWPSYINPSKRG